MYAGGRGQNEGMAGYCFGFSRSFCKRTSVRGNKMAAMSLGTNGNPGDVKGGWQK
jgi:hypothetical protein